VEGYRGQKSRHSSANFAKKYVKILEEVLGEYNREEGEEEHYKPTDAYPEEG
jgi:hypothetical protein